MKAKIKILYSEGRCDETKPGTFSIELRRWTTRYDCDYILESNLVTDDKLAKQPFLSNGIDYKIMTTIILLDGDANTDGAAIRAAVEKFNEVSGLADAIKSVLAQAAS